MKKFLPKIKIFTLITVCVAFFIAFFCLYSKKPSANSINENIALTVWQIDSFEGGKGSRAEYLQNLGNNFGKNENCYITVVSLSAESARLNLSNGNIPDIISYGAGMFGVEGYINDFTVWCRGSYCLLTLDNSSDFSDTSGENTVVNKGKDNYSDVAALFCGLQNAKFESSTSAYVKLINGDCKYLLGTQRDIFRLKTRGVTFSVKPVTTFNDLYQNISKTTNCANVTYAQKFIDYVVSKKAEISRIGMYCDGVKLYDDELSVCESSNYEYTIKYPINEEMKSSIKRGVTLGDINILKELLK